MGTMTEEDFCKGVDLVKEMSRDYLCGTGPTKRAYIMTLRTAANQLEKMLNADEKPKHKETT
jgi:hypothetical protein